MKVAIAFVLAAACFAVSISGPASRNVDWDAVADKIKEIEPQICGCIQQIIIIASNDNEQVGSAISDKLKYVCGRVKVILEPVEAAIRDHSLTEEKAKELLGRLKDILAEIQSAIQAQLAQLSSGAAAQIRDVFYSCYASAEQKAQEIYALLRQ